MATNLHALIRYRALDICFREKRRNRSWEELSAACGDALREYERSNMRNPSRRTVFGDLDVMKNGKLGFYAPIVFSRDQGYYYSNPDFSMERQPLTEEYKGYLGEALFTLKQFTWSTQLLGLDDIIARLEHGILGEANKHRPVLQIDQPVRFTGLKWLDLLLKAIRQEKRIRIVYRPFYLPDPFSTDVSPYLLKEYNGRWFLVGFDHTNDRLQNYGLDRINDILPLTMKIQAPPFDLREHYRQVVGVTVLPDRTMERVVFHAIPEQSFYIFNKPIHHSQRVISEDATGTTFAIDVIPNFELESILLSFGERIEVLEPESLRARLGERMQKAFCLYKTP